MEEGFVLDKSYGHGWAEITEWMQGAPEKSFWTGVKMKQRARRPVTTWRCTKCGFLESFAL
jgi:hypothetical protein